MYVIVQIEPKKTLALEGIYVMPNFTGKAVEIFPTKEAAHKLIQMLWNLESEEELLKNNIQIWRMH